MKEKFKNLIQKLLRPKVWFALCWIILSLAVIAVTLTSLIVKFLPAPVEYVFYGLSAVGLAYSVYIIVKVAPKIKGKIIEILKGWEFTKTVLENYGFRTVVFAIFSFAMSIAYAVMQGYVAIKNLSVWYGALATYYVVLAFVKGGLLNSKRSAKKRAKKGQDYTKNMINVYGLTGIGLFVLTVALSSTIWNMVSRANTFSYPGFTIFASAAYAFYKISMAIYNFVKARRFDDLTVRAIRNVNLSDALVSILALQTALLDQFGDGNQNNWIFNLITGIAVSAIIIAVAIIMFIQSRKMFKKLKREEVNARERV